MNTLLVVDDDSLVVNMLAKAVAKLDVNFIRASGTKQARMCLKGAQIDIMIVDLHLPDGNGLELMKDVQAGTTVFVLTGYSANYAELLSQLLETGKIKHVLSKPSSPANVVDLIREELKQRLKACFCSVYISC